MPLVLFHQKYTVAMAPKMAAKPLGETRIPLCPISLTSLSSRPRYCPAVTMLMGPVRM